MTTLLPSVVPCTAGATSRQATPALASSASSPARHASEGSGYVVSRLAVVSSPAGDCSTKSVNVPPTSKPIRYDTKSAPPLRAREQDAVRVALSRLVADGVLHRLAIGRVVRALEHQQRRARAHLQQLGDLARRRDAAGGRRAEGAAPGVAIEPSLLHQDVEGLAHGGPADFEAGAEAVLGCDALALAAQVSSDGVGDLEIPRNTRTVVHPALLEDQKLSGQIAPGPGPGRH